VKVFRCPDEPAVRAVLIRVARTADERLLEDEPDPQLSGTVRSQGTDRRDEKGRSRKRG
jgi:hypothetical protein